MDSPHQHYPGRGRGHPCFQGIARRSWLLRDVRHGELPGARKCIHQSAGPVRPDLGHLVTDGRPLLLQLSEARRVASREQPGIPADFQQAAGPSRLAGAPATAATAPSKRGRTGMDVSVRFLDEISPRTRG